MFGVFDSTAQCRVLFEKGKYVKYIGISLLALFVNFFAYSKDTANSDGALKIPYKLIAEEGDSDIRVNDDIVTILATKGTDLYTNADGSNSNDNAPRIFFEPKSDFTFSAKVSANFTSPYDGGALFLYADKDNWGKLLFERFKNGDNGIASTVTRSTGDDAYHYSIDDNKVHLKIIRKNNTFTFLYSREGKQWSYLRSFSMDSVKAIKVGFIAQSPISQTHQVIFSNVEFKE